MITADVAKRRRIVTPDDLAVGDEVFIHVREWKRGRIVRMIAPVVNHRHGPIPRRAEVAIFDGSNVYTKRCHELIPACFTDRGDGGPPKYTRALGPAMAHAKELWALAASMGGASIVG